MNENKRPALSRFNTPLRCEYYRCNNLSTFRIGDPAGPQSVIHTLCEEHVKQVIVEGNGIFPELAGLDVKVREAFEEVEATKKELAELAENKNELETALERALQVNNKQQEKIQELEQTIAKITVDAQKNIKSEPDEPKRDPKKDAKKKG